VAILLSEGITRVRSKTRHDVDTRVSDTLITDGLNDGVTKLRAKLAVDVPTLYLVTSGAIDVAQDAPEITLADTAYTFANLRLVERCWEDGRWRRIMRADEENPNESIHGRISFRIENMCLIIGPDYRDDLGGQYRVKFHPTPTRLATPADNAKYLQIPDALDLAVVYYACIPVAERDKESSTEWEKKAKAEYDEALPGLQERYGMHTNQAWLHRVVGY
jgi:hypothetical protein